MKQYIFKAAEIFVNILMVLSALGAVVAIAYIIFLAQGSGMEKIVACYLIIIVSGGCLRGRRLLGEAGYEAVGCTLRLYDGGEGGYDNGTVS